MTMLEIKLDWFNIPIFSNESINQISEKEIDN